MPVPTTESPFDAYAPPRIASMVEGAGVRKAGMDALPTITLGILAGAFIALGAMYYTVVTTGSGFGFGPTRMLGGVAFSVGLILVVVGGAELFTGNNLIVMAWISGHVTGPRLLRNWGLVYAANLVGALGLALMGHWAGLQGLAGGEVGGHAAAIARAKVNLGFWEAFWRGVLCNLLVCLAVWLSFAARTVAGKAVAVVFPVSAFVALGFEHSVANMYLIPAGMLAGDGGIALGGMLKNLIPVTLGNVVGGGGLVALVYWAVYLRGADPGP